MKLIRAWLNEEQYKAYTKNAEKMGKTPYAVTKQLALNFLKKRKQQNQNLLILYFFVVYSLITTGVLLFLIF